VAEHIGDNARVRQPVAVQKLIPETGPSGFFQRESYMPSLSLQVLCSSHHTGGGQFAPDPPQALDVTHVRRENSIIRQAWQTEQISCPRGKGNTHHRCHVRPLSLCPSFVSSSAYSLVVWSSHADYIARLYGSSIHAR
jgi:hypothetical protein